MAFGRLERETNKMGLSTADMLGLLALLETDERNINSNNRPISDIDDLNLALYYRMLLGGNANPLKDDTTNEGEWLNGLVEPSVQYYGRMEPSPRDRRPYTGAFQLVVEYNVLSIVNCHYYYYEFSNSINSIEFPHYCSLRLNLFFPSVASGTNCR